MWPTRVVGCVGVGVAVDKLIHHAVHGQAGGQDERCCSIVHAGVKVCGTVSDEDLQRRRARLVRGKRGARDTGTFWRKARHLENTLGVCGHGGVEWRATHVVLDISVGAGLQEAFSGIRASIAGSQVEGSFARAVCLVMEVGTLVDKVGYDLRRGVFLLLAVASLQASAAAGRDHQGGETI